VTTTFPRAKRSSPGYDVSQVEAFLELARSAYDSEAMGATRLSSSDIRQASFAMHKGGYSCRHVDSALERLELAFARRERDRAIEITGTQAWVDAGQARLEVLLARFERPVKDRFNRVGLLSRGYSTKDVDAFVDAASAALGKGKPFAVEQVRSSLFRPRLRGYNETQVDVVLDALVEVLLAVGTD
jgi:DivIVA domain-containing protein